MCACVIDLTPHHQHLQCAPESHNIIAHLTRATSAATQPHLYQLKLIFWKLWTQQLPHLHAGGWKHKSSFWALSLLPERAPVIGHWWQTSWVILLCSVLRLNGPEFCSNRERHTKLGKRHAHDFNSINSLELSYFSGITGPQQNLSVSHMLHQQYCNCHRSYISLLRVLHRGVRMLCLSLLMCSKARFCSFCHLKPDSLSIEQWKSRK